MPDAQGNDRSEFADIISEVITKMKVPAIVLNVTSMGAVRSDAHIGKWSHPVVSFDCSHWCLPGVPDAWNELLFSYLLTDGKFSFWRSCTNLMLQFLARRMLLDHHATLKLYGTVS